MNKDEESVNLSLAEQARVRTEEMDKNKELRHRLIRLFIAVTEDYLETAIEDADGALTCGYTRQQLEEAIQAEKLLTDITH